MFRAIFLIFLVSCGGPGIFQQQQEAPFPYAGIGIDDAFFTQVSAFEAEWGHQVSNIDMFFVQRIEGYEVGSCMSVKSRDYAKAIRIEKASWDRGGPIYREALVMHELGHCALGRDHNDRKAADGCALSVMSPDIGDVLPCYRPHRKFYMDELFGRKSE